MTLSSQSINITLLFTIATYFLSGKPFDLKVFLYDNVEKIRNNDLLNQKTLEPVEINFLK